MTYKGKSISLERKDPSPLGDIMPQVLRALRLSSGMNEHIILSAWDEVTGAGACTLDKYMKNGVLTCVMSSSVVRNHLFFNKEAIVEAINGKALANPLYAAVDGVKPVKSLVLR